MGCSWGPASPWSAQHAHRSFSPSVYIAHENHRIRTKRVRGGTRVNTQPEIHQGRPTFVAAMLFTRSREQATTPGADRCTRESKRETTDTHTHRDGERGGRIEIEQAIGQKGGLEETTQTWQTRGRVFGCHLQGESTLAQQGQHWARADHYKTHTQVQGRQSVAKMLILKSDSHFSQCWP